MADKQTIAAGDVGELKIVEAVGTAGNSVKDGPTASEIEGAMGEAIEHCLANGITDPGEILKAKMAARQAVKDRYKEEAPKG
jgi:hypothetical protein